MEARLRKVEDAILSINEMLKHMATKEDLLHLRLRLERPLWIGIGVIGVITTLGGFFLNRTWNVIALLLKASGH